MLQAVKPISATLQTMKVKLADKVEITKKLELEEM